MIASIFFMGRLSPGLCWLPSDHGILGGGNVGFQGGLVVTGDLWGRACYLGIVVQKWAVWEHHDRIADSGADEGD